MSAAQSLNEGYVGIGVYVFRCLSLHKMTRD